MARRIIVSEKRASATEFLRMEGKDDAKTN